MNSAKSGLAALLAGVLSFTAMAVDQMPTDPAPGFHEARAAADAGGNGPYPAEVIEEASLPGHTVYRPRDLGRVGGRLPIIAWGNGGCMNRGDLNRYLLVELASHGYLTLVSGPIGTNDLEDVLTRIAEAQKPGSQSTPAQLNALIGEMTTAEPKTVGPELLTQAIDWAIAENGRKGSPYYHRLDTQRIGVGGGSCGGLQAIHIAATDNRVVTAFMMNSGTLATDPASRAEVKRIHVPVAYVTGDATDVAYPNASADFEAITAIPVFWASLKGVGHTGTSLQPHGGAFGALMIDWFNWQLRNDKAAAKSFLGSDCRYCMDPRWVVTKKRLDL